MKTTDYIGRVVGGRYELLELRDARDAQPSFAALDLDLDRPVEVQLHRYIGNDRASLRRFRDEARVLSRIHHSGLEEIRDFGQLEDSTPFLVVSEAEGALLSEILGDGPLDHVAAINVLVQLARALELAHQVGVLHLALSPERVRFGQSVQLLDLLTARWHALDCSSPIPLDWRVCAPEILRGDAVDARADVYGLGLLAYACLVGGLPAVADEDEARALHLSDQGWEVPHDSQVPEELAVVIERCLEQDRDLRPPTCASVVEELESWQSSTASTQRLPAVRPQAGFFPQIGDVFADKYVIEGISGQGAFARVFRARSMETQREVALKVLRPDRSRDTSDARRFVREGRLVFSMLTNPHTISVYGFGETDDGLLYIAFEYIEGQTLAATLRDEEKLGATRVVRILEQCLVSLAEAHGLGVLHRDIKPSNIMLSHRDGVDDWVTVLDFGLAKITSDIVDRTVLTVAGKAVGTPRYMSPEQIAGEALGPESDLYSLGLVCYELLTGAPAITGDNVFELLTAQLGPHSPILTSASNVPVPLALIINRMMRKDRASRYASARDILADLRQLERTPNDQTMDTGAR